MAYIPKQRGLRIENGKPLPTAKELAMDHPPSHIGWWHKSGDEGAKRVPVDSNNGDLCDAAYHDWDCYGVPRSPRRRR